MADWIIANCGQIVFVATFLLAMLPITETKLALPMGMSTAIWGDRALSAEMSFLACYLGSTLVGLAIFFILSPICRALKKRHKAGKITKYIESKFSKGMSGFVNLAFFIMIPLPMTGVWSGAAFGSFGNGKALSSSLAIAVGNFVATGLMYLVCLFFDNSSLYLAVIGIGLTIIYSLIVLLSKFIKRKTKISQ